MTTQGIGAPPMRVARLLATIGDLRRQLAHVTGERDAARLVIADQAAALHSLGDQNAYLLQERSELDAAHRAALADITEMQRQLDERDSLSSLTSCLATIEAPALHDEPDMERFG
ncbi:hypothetical protein I5G97_gp062 [Mycobacterium phage Curiosium]|uniref:Uncharacterized protein n=1 Tax=Mycobacterium phage Curiosium TaxID=2599859 RepID=A0A5J6U079_9CAUD|nr:hypothetical protein I5G97_gp062 [Mycobacterium phage Curiosium]QFG14092.1 hypothetical protein PBI_CURIOSIUM_48 [Mycobacterium phage Curiosium]